MSSSDAAPPPPPVEHPSSELSSSQASTSSSYAFITHSQETLPLNLPPTIDNATLARRRRRRTSARDQAILEEEYRLCDRPDKAKRREITSKVDMGEKEVQIWFQNKRQSTRRKTRPLISHELLTMTSTESGVASILSIPVARSQNFSDSEPITTSKPQPQGRSMAPLVRSSTLPATLSSSPLPRLPPTDRYSPSRPPLPRLSTHDALQAAISSDVPPPVPPLRRSISGFQPPSLNRRSSSFLRLSTSLEGKAEIVLPDSDVPALTPDNSQGSRAAVESSPTPHTPGQRKIDSRVWSYLCDNRQAVGANGSKRSVAALQPEEAHTAISLMRVGRNLANSVAAARQAASSPARMPLGTTTASSTNSARKRKFSPPQSVIEQKPVAAQVKTARAIAALNPNRKRNRTVGEERRFKVEIFEDDDKENGSAGKHYHHHHHHHHQGKTVSKVQSMKALKAVPAAQENDLEAGELLLSLRGGIWAQ
ncbi:hypothetical protein BJ508DRAFT_323490 [Ascobolus immersus RN42]|uniref:Homeobox domain-containing protein n=1 Tax=Ascobolus immersus RN42 TaxID=1160509 RepID=A0A3N4IK73_ASCIM|nr:hypothetical protein BJ508DRAFT_323490 [Ascobolus immersus RN42]